MTEPFPPLDSRLTEAILARTSGSPCRRLEALACDLVDGLLEPVQASLAEAHLAHCPACRTLVAGLRELDAVLPAFAELDPGPAFTADILEETLPRPGPSFHTTWIRLMRRPRICLETAFLGTVAGLLTLQAPLPLRALTGPALSRLAAPLDRMPPILQASQARSRACASRATLAATQEARRVRTFWGEVVATLRSWLARFSGAAGRTL